MLNSNAFTTRQLSAPSSLTGYPLGLDVRLGWSAGQNGNGYEVLGLPNGTNSICPNNGYSTIGFAAGTDYTDYNRFAPQGTWFCYQVKTKYGSWSSSQNNPAAGVQIGVVASSVEISNGGVSGQWDAGDRVVVTFNQPIDPTTGPLAGNTVCADPTTQQIWLASSRVGGSGLCQTNEPTTLGKLSGSGLSGSGARFSATFVWSNGNRTITVTLGTRTDGVGNPIVSTGTWTFAPTTDSTKLKSASGNVHLCDSNTGGSNCLPATTSLP